MLWAHFVFSRSSHNIGQILTVGEIEGDNQVQPTHKFCAFFPMKTALLFIYSVSSSILLHLYTESFKHSSLCLQVSLSKQPSHFVIDPLPLSLSTPIVVISRDFMMLTMMVRNIIRGSDPGVSNILDKPALYPSIDPRLR